MSLLVGAYGYLVFLANPQVVSLYSSAFPSDTRVYLQSFDIAPAVYGGDPLLTLRAGNPSAKVEVFNVVADFSLLQ